MTIKVAPKKLKAFKRRVKQLTGRSRGISMKRRLTDLNRYLRGWIGYFGLARQFDDVCRSGRLDSPSSSDVLLETVALSPHEGS